MKSPATPHDESDRLAALGSYEIIDTPEEAPFDALTRLAAAILEVPIALVSLVDADRQWFKSRYGLEVTQTPRAVSFCGHVVAEGAPLVVLDAFDDARFADNPLSTGEPRVRFYAGMPLRTPDGFVLGTLCAIDHVPRKLTPKQLELLSLLAGQVVDQLEARRKRRLLAEERAAAVENARRLTVLFEAMEEGVVVQDNQGRITSANTAAGRLLGLSLDQLAGRTSTDPSWHTIHEDGSPFPGETHPAVVALSTGEPSRNTVMGVHKPDGELTWININALPMRAEPDQSAYAVITTFHDVTAIKAAQVAAEHLARQEHLVTTGTLAAGIGHEINNPLTFILSNIEFALEELRSLAGGSPSGRLLELVSVLGEARDGAERIRKIVRGLRALAREESAPIPTLVDGPIEIAINMAAHEVRTKATVVKELLGTPPVMADESRITQIVVNLLTNAAQAFPNGDVEKNRITVATALGLDGRVVIEVRDNGPGIPIELQKRVFDPFFTTKAVGKGTGLGLSISLGIVRALGGELFLESAPGKGTAFRVVLPPAKAALEARHNARPLEAKSRGRVLIVDDEVAILNVVRRSLERDYDVVVLTDGREALARIARGEQFDVVLCDLMMPHLPGDALYAHTLPIAPQLAERFVFMSGGATEPRIVDFLDRVPNERVEKPFNLQNLRAIVRRFVDSGR